MPAWWIIFGGTQGSETRTYQWTRDLIPIPLATATTYVTTPQDRGHWIACVETVTNSAGSTSKESNSIFIGAVTPTNTLGCGRYDAYILTRGGGSLVAVLPWNTLSWGRVLDDTSHATVTVDSECGELGSVRPWQHELAIYRDDLLVWVGPITNPSAPVAGDHQQLQVDARDLSAWWDHRRIHVDHAYVVPTDLATIFQDFATDAMSVDNSPGLVVKTTACGVLGVRSILGTQHQIAGLELRDLAKTGIDWTAVGRTVLAGGSAVPTASIGTFTDAHFTQPPKPNLDGTAQANDWVVRGAGGGVAGDVVYGEASDTSAQERDGVLEAVDTVSTIQDNTSAAAAAQTRVALTTGVLSVEEAYLAATAPFTIDQLVPGAVCYLDLQETVIPIQGQYRLQSVDPTARGNDGVEQVVLVFQPVGTP